MKYQINYYKIFKYCIIPLNIILIALLVLDFIQILPAYWSSIYVFYILLIINTWFLALRLKHIPEHEREHDYTVFWSKYLFLLGLVVIAVNQFLKRQMITDYMGYIIGFVIAVGFLTFFASKNRVEKEIEDEKEKEEQAEKKRKGEFASKFPRINKIPILRSVVKWMYGEGWAFSIPFVIIAIIFITIKIGIPWIYSTTFMDENIHIFSGIDLFKNGGFPKLFSETYTRGLYVTFMVGLFTNFFGKTIFIAKMVPATMGIFNFFLLFYISKKVFDRKINILLMLVMYTIIPWFIFNHFYIRMYVFYEFFILLLTLFFILIIEKITNIKKSIEYLIIIFITLLMIYFFSNDGGKFMIILYFLLFISYIYIFQIYKIPIQNKLYKNFSKNNILKIFLFIIIFIIIFSLKGYLLMKDFIYGQVIYTSGVDLKYNNLFFSLNILFTLLFLCSFGLLFSKKIKDYIQFIIISSLILFLIHFNSSLDLQMTRIIIYFLPLFYLISMISFSRFLLIYNSKIVTIILILFLALNIYSNYPTDFIKGPYIPSEVKGMSHDIYIDVQNLCKDQIIITSNTPWWNEFYGFDKQYYLNTWYSYDKINFSDNEMSFVYFNQNEKRFKDIYTDMPVIIDLEELQNVTSNDNFCYISGGLPSNWINSETQKFILDKFNLIKKYGSPNCEIEMKLYKGYK